MKMILTLRVEWEIADLSDYDATTLEEAVANQRKWIEEGNSSLVDFVEDMKIVDLRGEE